MLEMQQQNIGDVDLLSLKPMLLAGDAGGVQARRALTKLIEAEQSASANG
jgi:vanillate O-demethylase monooxygenase subunit